MPLSITSSQLTYGSVKPVLPEDRRINRRFPLRQAATLRCKNILLHEIPVYTVNASVNSVLVTSEISLLEGSTVQVVITLEQHGLESLKLRGTGKVVRAEETATGRFGLAIAFDKPLSASAESRS